MSDDQEIHVEDLCTEKQYFSQIPNIIHRMGLGCYVVAYYCLLKSIAREKSTCYMKQKNIAKMLGCSDRQIRIMNNIMTQEFEILGGKPLIKIKHRKDSSGENLPNIIQVVDIWVENITAIQKLEEESKDIKEKFSAELRSGGAEYGSGGAEPGADNKEECFKKKKKKEDSKSSSSEEIPIPLNKNDDACGADDDSCKNIGENIWFRKTNGQMKKITQSEIYRHFLKLPFSTETLNEAIERFKGIINPINNALKYIESICVTIDKEKENKPSKAKKTPVKDPSQENEKIKEETITFEEYFKCHNKTNPFHSGKQ